jgi:hypothetical protein
MKSCAVCNTICDDQMQALNQAPGYAFATKEPSVMAKPKAKDDLLLVNEASPAVLQGL